jgi:hypothetical protein
MSDMTHVLASISLRRIIGGQDGEAVLQEAETEQAKK